VRSIPSAVWLCALVAFLNAAAWSLWTPPMQSPDEPVHVYYVQYLAETGKVPHPGPEGDKSQEELVVEAGTKRADIVANFFGRPLWTEAQAEQLRKTLDERPSRRGTGGDAGVGSYPPLYYAVLVVPYKLATWAGANPVDRLNAMRLGSALIGAVAIFFVTLFLRELLPRHRWAWVTGGLACALLPYFAFIAGSVNPDAGVAASAAALFYFIARAFRVGLTPGVAAGLGLATAAAFLSKLSGIGLLPGAALVALWLTFRPAPLERPAAMRGLLIAAGCAALPVAVYIALNLTVWDRPLVPSSGGVAPPGATVDLAPGSRNLQGYLTFAWQYVFPQLPFMFNWFDGWAPYDLWLSSWIGRFGWGDSGYERWIVALAGVTVLALLGFFVRALWQRRAVVRARWAEILAYLVLAGGLFLLLSWVGYGYRTTNGATFEQGRYLFPLMSLWGALIAIGLTGIGRRVGPVIAFSVVLLVAALDVGGVMIMIQRYYAG
jgi:4-amino-4-deoxy-L-arabinose transferase-like glycosyltransferase